MNIQMNHERKEHMTFYREHFRWYINLIIIITRLDSVFTERSTRQIKVFLCKVLLAAFINSNDICFLLRIELQRETFEFYDRR